MVARIIAFTNLNTCHIALRIKCFIIRWSVVQKSSYTAWLKVRAVQRALYFPWHQICMACYHSRYGISYRPANIHVSLVPVISFRCLTLYRLPMNWTTCLLMPWSLRRQAINSVFISLKCYISQIAAAIGNLVHCIYWQIASGLLK